jgi:CheY-like chemotaxis protein
MDGFEFLKLVKDHDQWSGIPIVILTSMDLTKSDHDQLSGSVSTILRKSDIDPQQLLSILGGYRSPKGNNNGNPEGKKA